MSAVPLKDNETGESALDSAARKAAQSGASAAGPVPQEGLVPPDYRPVNLGGWSQSVVRALVRGLAPRKVTFRFDAAFELTGFVDRFVGYLPRLVALVFPVGLQLINWSGVLTSGKPLTMMSAEEGERHLQKLGDSPVFAIREAVKGLRSLILMGYYAHPEVRAFLHYYPQEWVDQKVAERVTRWGLRVPDLLDIANEPGGPEGVTIRGDFNEQMKPDGKVVDFRDAYTRASPAEIEAARRAAESAASRLNAREG
jgi:hypothetical protein